MIFAYYHYRQSKKKVLKIMQKRYIGINKLLTTECIIYRGGGLKMGMNCDYYYSHFSPFLKDLSITATFPEDISLMNG